MMGKDVKQEYINAYVHEMNNIAANIAGAVDILLENKITDWNVLEKYLKVVSGSVVDLKGQIKSIVMLNQLDSYQEEFEKKDFDLRNQAQDFVDKYVALADRKNVSLRFSTNLEENVCVDGEKLMIVISNLVGNALKFTGSGEVALEITKIENVLEIKVSDTGKGMDEEEIATLFDCYTQGSDKREGFGIGLYISKHFVQMHQGSIEVKSKKGEGSVFKVTLPV